MRWRQLALPGSVNYLILGFVIGMCNGFAIPIAQLFGAHDDSDLRRHVANATWLCIAWGVVLTVVTVALTRPIMELMQTPADIIDGASTYIGWIFAGIPFVFLYNMVSAIMRALGDSKTPLYFLVLTSAVNIVLDLVLIINFNMGVLGAAVATDVSQAISGVISLIYLIKKFKILHMTRDEWKYSRSTCRRLSAMGLPMGLQCTITAVGGVIMQWAVNGLGSSVVAAITAAGKTQNLLSCALESIGTAMATYAGQNLGAARLDRVRSGVKSSYIMVVAYSVLAFIALHFGDVVIIGLFLDTKTEVEIVTMARDYMFWNSLFFIPLGRAHRMALYHSGAGLFHTCHDGRCGRNGGAYRYRPGADSGAGLFWRRAVQPGSLGGGLPVPVPGLPVDGQTPGKPPACRPPCHAAQRGRGLTP